MFTHMCVCVYVYIVYSYSVLVTQAEGDGAAFHRETDRMLAYMSQRGLPSSLVQETSEW